MTCEKNKVFEAQWGNGYAQKGVFLVGEEFFYPDNGYSMSDIKKVEGLKVGQKTDLSDQSGNHVVRRKE